MQFWYLGLGRGYLETFFWPKKISLFRLPTSQGPRTYQRTSDFQNATSQSIFNIFQIWKRPWNQEDPLNKSMYQFSVWSILAKENNDQRWAHGKAKSKGKEKFNISETTEKSNYSIHTFVQHGSKIPCVKFGACSSKIDWVVAFWRIRNIEKRNFRKT